MSKHRIAWISTITAFNQIGSIEFELDEAKKIIEELNARLCPPIYHTLYPPVKEQEREDDERL